MLTFELIHQLNESCPSCVQAEIFLALKMTAQGDLFSSIFQPIRIISALPLLPILTLVSLNMHEIIDKIDISLHLQSRLRAYHSILNISFSNGPTHVDTIVQILAIHFQANYHHLINSLSLSDQLRQFNGHYKVWLILRLALTVYNLHSE